MQGNKWLFAIISSVAAMSFTSPAMANMMSAPCGWFLEANVGSTHLGNVSYPGDSSSSGVGYNANLGYKFMPYAALELGGAYYPTTKIKDDTGLDAASVKHYSYDLAAKAILPISDSGFEGFAKLGVVHVVSNIQINDDEVVEAAALGLTESSHSATGIYLGVGGQFYITPEFALVAQWQRAQGNSSTGTADLFSVGISMLFV